MEEINGQNVNPYEDIDDIPSKDKDIKNILNKY